MAVKTDAINEIFPDINCVIFDLDGTLIDSVPVYFELMETILKAIGLPPAPKSVVAEFMTVGRKTSRSTFKDRMKLFSGVPRLFNRLVGLKTPI